MPRNDERKGTSNRGFASMDQAKQRKIASKGGQSVPPEKRSFSQDPQLAAQAGRKGGESVPPEGRSFSQNRELAAQAGRKGGQSRGAAARAARAQQARSASADASSTEKTAPETSERKTAANPGVHADQTMHGAPADETITSDDSDLPEKPVAAHDEEESGGFAKNQQEAVRKGGPQWHGTR